MTVNVSWLTSTDHECRKCSPDTLVTNTTCEPLKVNDILLPNVTQTTFVEIISGNVSLNADSTL